MSKALNVQNLTLNDAARTRSPFGGSGAVHRRQREPFLKGPISMAWLERAMKLPGKAVHVAVLLRYRSGVERQLTVKLTSALLRSYGIERDAKARALRELERAGLITVERTPGRNPVVTIVEVTR